MARLKLIVPIALAIIFIILNLQFSRVSTTIIVFASVFVAWAGGFVMLWLYNTTWFLNIFNLSDVFQIHPIQMSVAVWVGFLALFGIATDDGVLMSTILDAEFAEKKPSTRQEVKEMVVHAGKKRIRPVIMTSATTILALLPILSSAGRGADVMIPMAIPSFGGMLIVMISLFVFIERRTENIEMMFSQNSQAIEINFRLATSLFFFNLTNENLSFKTSL
jgi:copper/silver efflux system protein